MTRREINVELLLLLLLLLLCRRRRRRRRMRAQVETLIMFDVIIIIFFFPSVAPIPRDSERQGNAATNRARRGAHNKYA